jgi:hypothetical protein
MAFAWKMLIPLALANVVIVGIEVLLWKELELSDWILAAYVAINAVLALALFGFFFRMVTRDYYRLPRRVRLEHDVFVPSLPAPPNLRPAADAGVGDA